LETLAEFIPVRNTLVWDKGTGPGYFYTSEHELILFGTGNTAWKCKGARNIIRGIKSFAGGAKATNGEMVHPAQKPVELIAKLIEDGTEQGGVVLDCFMGSGTTAVAAIRTGRQFIGCEHQAKYLEVAERRIEQELKK
jgi:site-specific DNA-methyltransferase (adenine-specific)